MDHDKPDIAALLAIWIRGWALVRGLPAPSALPEGAWRVDVGQPEQWVRYLIPGGKLALAARLAHELHAPATWLKVCAEHDALAAVLPARWKMSDQRAFMGKTLAENATLAVPDGFTLSLTEAGAVTRAILCGSGGRKAAEGNIVVMGRHAVFDQIGTEAEFRRRGLGRVIMQALAERALARGAQEGLLVATEVGQQLYLTLDWHELSPYASAFIPGMASNHTNV
jgi:GNAT superfamily N-acetyltransferase